MKRIAVALVVALLIAAGPLLAQATLLSQYTLSQDNVFAQRVRQAIVTAAIAVSSEVLDHANHPRRVILARQVLLDPTFMSARFVEGVASDPTVSAAAGSPNPVQANVTDVQINNAITSQWDAYAGVQ